MRFLTVFPNAENIHLTKDVGMIPFALHKEHGYESTIACYENGAYPYLGHEVAGLKIVFIKRIFKSPFLDVLWFLWCNRKQYDVLQVYHLRFSSLLWLFVFKLFSKRHLTYLKLDVNERILNYNFKGPGAKVNKMLLRSVHIISAETASIQQQLTKQWKHPILLVPNGFYKPGAAVTYPDKKRIILTTGRIGAAEKRHEVLLEAFAGLAAAVPSWTLQLTGPVEKHFEHYIENYFRRYPQLKSRVQFTGPVQDRKLLFEQYAAAKIFCLSSAREGFPLSLVEAASAGCYLVCSAIIAAPDITGNEKYGRIFPVDDTDALVEILKYLAKHEAVIEDNVIPVQEYADRHFSWKTIAAQIDIALHEQFI